MRKIESEYEIDKQKRKQRLVRNEFLFTGKASAHTICRS